MIDTTRKWIRRRPKQRDARDTHSVKATMPPLIAESPATIAGATEPSPISAPSGTSGTAGTPKPVTVWVFEVYANGSWQRIEQFTDYRTMEETVGEIVWSYQTAHFRTRNLRSGRIERRKAGFPISLHDYAITVMSWVEEENRPPAEADQESMVIGY